MKLSEFVDGCVDESEAAAIEAHLARCAECRAVLDDLRHVDGLLREEMAPVEPPAAIWEGLQARIHDEREAGVGKRRFFWDRLCMAFPVARHAALPTLVVLLFVGLSSSFVPWQGLPPAGVGAGYSEDRINEAADAEIEEFERVAWQQEMDALVARENEAAREIHWQIMDRTAEEYLRELQLRSMDSLEREWRAELGLKR